MSEWATQRKASTTSCTAFRANFDSVSRVMSADISGRKGEGKDVERCKGWWVVGGKWCYPHQYRLVPAVDRRLLDAAGHAE